MNALFFINALICTLVILILLVASFDAFREKEFRALRIFLASCAVCIGMSALILFAGTANTDLLFILPVLLFVTGLIFYIYPSPKQEEYTYSNKQIDERDIMFSRAELEPGSERHTDYYQRNPEKFKLDNEFREQPGLLSKDAPFYVKKTFQKAEQNFKDVKLLHALVNKTALKTANTKVPEKPLEDLKTMAVRMGAHSFGSTKTQAHHWYSIKGRDEEYGIPIENKLPFVIVFTIEMDYFNMQKAPKADVVMESSQQYLNSGKIAIALAEKLRSWGFEARAHIDGNYQLICPLVARDARLGEIGRMGLLMTPKLGPRVRIAAVTTNMPLPINSPKTDRSVLNFCDKCKICAESCPAQAISNTIRTSINGSLRWQINQEKCFTLWCKFGTDCGVCMKKCPYSHPNTLSHQLVRFGIKHSELFQSLALSMEKRIYK